MKWKSIIWLALGGLVLIVVACQPQVVEVEVTRVVTETVTEEVIVEGETVIEEVEVTRVVIETITETEVEIVEEEAEEAEESLELGEGGDNIEATGSEEDGGSPFVPTAGQRLKVAPTRVASAGWVNMRAVTENPEMMAEIEATAGDIVLVHQFTTTFGESTLLLSNSSLIFFQQVLGLPDVPTVRAPMSADLIQLLATFEPSDDLIELTAQTTCDRCANGGNQETLVFLWPDSGLTMTMDQGESVPALDLLLAQIRQIHNQYIQQETLRAFRLSETEN